MFCPSLSFNPLAVKKLKTSSESWKHTLKATQKLRLCRRLKTQQNTVKTCTRGPGCDVGGSRRGLHVAQLVGDGEGGAQSVVFTDAAAPVRIAHRPQLGQAWRDDTSVGGSQLEDLGRRNISRSQRTLT